MEFLFEFILELFLERSMEASSNKKLSKWIRYPLMLLVIVFFVSVIGLVFLTGILSFSTNKMFSIFILIMGILMLVGTILKFKDLYLKRK